MLFRRQAPLSGAAGGARRDARFVPLVQGSELLAKRQKGFPLVGVLTAETATGSHDTGRQMREADAALCDVLMLSSLAA